MSAVGATRRRVERHGAAALRALSGRADAELRAGRPTVDGRPLAMATPYLASDPAEAPLDESRGLIDSVGLLLRYSDRAVHRELSPDSLVERVIFDILEQLRCESLVPDGFRGVRGNLNVAFDAWDSSARAAGMTDGRLGVLVYTVTHMIRGRLVRGVSDHAVEEAIEATWFDIAPLIGHASALLKPSRADQRAYAEHALEVARVIAELAGDDAVELADGGVGGRYALLLPTEWTEPDESAESGDDAVADAGDSGEQADLLGLGDYCIYTTAYDRTIGGVALYPDAVLGRARDELDRRVTAQAVSIPRLARRLSLLFATPQRRGWNHGEEDGTVDGRRLSRLVTTPDDHRVFRQERHVPSCPVTVTFLVDTSGSMKRQRYESIAVLLDTFARALDLAGAECEVLGYTTGAWAGGRARRDWEAAGSPPDPGRLNEADHLVYKSADDTWRSSRRSLAAMMRTPHYREGLDGEALAWAYGRLLRRSSERRILVVVADGSPMDAATGGANREWFLDDHLAAVASHIERTGRVELGAVGLGLDMGTWFSNHVTVDLDGTITLATYDLIHRLFA